MSKPTSMFSPRKWKSGPGFQSECKACRNHREKERQKTAAYKKKRSVYCKREDVKKRRRERLSRPENKAARKKYTDSVQGKSKIKTAREHWANLPGNRMMLSMHESMRRMLKRAGDYKSNFASSTGTSREKFVAHIESLFQPGMTWENYGYRDGHDSGWDVDHRIPKSLYDHTNDDDIRRCWNIANLKPLWHTQNLRKTDKVVVAECMEVGQDYWPLSWNGVIPGN
jgi:hypothetical protein